MCVRYAARGGTLTTKTDAQHVCESLGGTYSGAEEPFPGAGSMILFRCSNLRTELLPGSDLDYAPEVEVFVDHLLPTCEGDTLAVEFTLLGDTWHVMVWCYKWLR